MSRFILMVLDGFGVGAMSDAAEYKEADAIANTCLHTLEKNPGLWLPQLERLGLMNALGMEMNGMRYSREAVFGKAKLMHKGADTYYGHQEIMGTNPLASPAKLQSFASVYDAVADNLQKHGYRITEYVLEQGGRAMGVNDAVFITDNRANDPGQTFCTFGLRHLIGDEEIMKISQLVRDVVDVSRVIAHAFDDTTYEALAATLYEFAPGYSGANTIPLDMYSKNMQILHMGKAVNAAGQVSTILHQHGVPVAHISKFADIVANPSGDNYSNTDTGAILDYLKVKLKEQKNGLIAVNIQETDIAGHELNAVKYGRILKQVDDGLSEILPTLGPDDTMLVMADHGNDPENGSVLHSREHVPLMLHGAKLRPCAIGLRETLSDTAATILDYFQHDPLYASADFGKRRTENGTSFWSLIKREGNG